MIESFVFSKTIEGYEFKPDAIPGTRDFSNNILALQEKSDMINESDTTIEKKYKDLNRGALDLSNNYYNTYNEFKDSNGNPKYNTIDLPDKTDLVKTTTDVRKEDISNLILQQNYVYIVGSITCATLLIAAIVIGKE